MRGAVRSRRMVEFTADSGGGKTALLRAVAPDAYIRVGATDLEDFLQDVVREFYEYPAGGLRLSAQECRRLLEEVNAVVALDDVIYGEAQITDLRSALRGCAVLVGAVRPVIGPLGASHPLPGLDDPDALALLARELGRLVAESELPDAYWLAAAVDGSPLALRQAAALVRYEGVGLAELARQAAADPGVLDELAIAALDPESLRALAVLALLGGAHLPARLVAAMAEVPPAAERFERLCARGLAERQGDRFGLSASRSGPYLRLLHRHLDFGIALRALRSWLQARDPAGAEARQAADAAVPLLGTAAGRREWDALLPLAAVVERVLLVQGHWRSWGVVLDLGRIAARGLSDPAAEAYFAHQEGTLHLLEGRREEAAAALAHALGLRTRLGDSAGAEASAVNLEFASGGGARSLSGETGRARQVGEAGGGVAGRLGGRWGNPYPGEAGAELDRARARKRRRVLVGTVSGAAVLVAGAAVGVGVVGSGGSGGARGPGSRNGASATDAGAEQGGSDSPGSDDSTQTTGTPGGPTTTGGPPTATAVLKPLRITGTRDYGQVHAGPAGATPVTELIIANPNGQPVFLEAITLTDASDFRITDGSCGTGSPIPQGESEGLAAGSSCTVTVRFTPSGLGRRAGTLTVDYSDGQRATAALTGDAYGTITVSVTPDPAGRRHGYVDILAGGATTRCDQVGACTVRYFDKQGPVTLTAHGDPVGQGQDSASGQTGGSGSTTDPSGPGNGKGNGKGSGNGNGNGKGKGNGKQYEPDSWTGPCAGSTEICKPAPGGDIATTVHFALGPS